MLHLTALLGFRCCTSDLNPPGLKVTASVPLSGPYSPVTWLDKMMARIPFSSPFYAPYLLVTMNQTHEIFQTDDLYLTQPYDKTLPPLIDGLHSEFEVNKAMPGYIEDMLNPALKEDLKAKRGPLYYQLEMNDMTGLGGSGYVKLNAPVHFIHGKEDELVPREHTDRVLKYMKDIQLKSNVDSVYLDSHLVMRAGNLAGYSYHNLYATIAIGESLEWLDNKIKGTQSLAE